MNIVKRLKKKNLDPQYSFGAQDGKSVISLK